MNILKKLFSALLIFYTIGSFAQKDFQHHLIFDNDWKFYLGEDKTAGSKKFDDKSWRQLNLPHDWSIEGIINPKNSSGGDGGFFPTGIGWYRKSFIAPPEWKDKKISVYFEGVYMNSEVFINGRSLGIYSYGYSGFSYDLTPYLELSTENVISVRVDNSQQKNSRWYSGSGIYRHVWLITTDPVHIAQWGIAISTPKVSENQAVVSIKTLIKNETGQSRQLLLSVALSDPASKSAGGSKIKVNLPENSEKEVSQLITVKRPSLWSTETPNLYRVKVSILHDNKLVDQQTTNLGIRSIRFSTDKGFQLNGKIIKLNGGCIHHDNGSLGAAAFDRAEERRIELLKSAGFNAIRTSHNPPSESFLSACDRLGMLVIDEAFDGWKEAKNKFDYSIYFDQWWKKDIEAMVRRDRNHPSIIMWSIGNEIIERKKPEAVATAKMLADGIKQIDTTRPVTSAMTTWDKEWNIFDPLMAVHDIVGYNYQLHRAAADHQRVPSRIIVQTESYPKDAFANWKLAHYNDYIIGDFVWTAMDYLGESGIGRWYQSGEATNFHSSVELFPWHGAYCGDIDLLGWRKPISHYRSMLYNDTEKLYMAVLEPNPEPLEIKTTSWAVWPTWESWTWPGYENKDLTVEVYSRYQKVRLYLNDKLIEEKSTGEQQEFKASFKVPYTKGELKAVGVNDGKELERKILKTAGEAAKIKLNVDRSTISANGNLSFITIEINDRNGVLQPNADQRLTFKVEGAAVIAAVDNANLKDPDPYVADVRRAWHGRAMLIIKSKKQIGEVKVTVSSLGLTTATANLKVK